MKPRDIKLMALDFEPVWLARFCGQRHGYAANDTVESLANPLPRTVLTPSTVRTSPRLGLRRAGDLLRGTWPTPGEGMGIGHDQENSHA